MLNITVNLLEFHEKGRYMHVMGSSMIIRSAATIALLAMSVSSASAQWNYEVDVKSQISANTLDCTSCDLTGKDLNGTRLKNSRFSGAILNRVNLSGGTIFNSDFSGAHLKKAFLARVRVEDVIFRGANLNDSTLTEIHVTNSDFQGASLTGAELGKGKMIKTNLRGANLGRIIGLATDFEGSDLSFAYLNGANLTTANFTDAILHKTNFGSANVSAATFTVARLEGAILTSAQGLIQNQMDAACGDGQTELPVDITISYCSETLADSPIHDVVGHDKMAERDQEIALRTDRALRNVETLMQSAAPEGRRALQRIHSDLLAIQRTVED